MTTSTHSWKLSFINLSASSTTSHSRWSKENPSVDRRCSTSRPGVHMRISTFDLKRCAKPGFVFCVLWESISCRSKSAQSLRVIGRSTVSTFGLYSWNCSTSRPSSSLRDLLPTAVAIFNPVPAAHTSQTSLACLTSSLVGTTMRPRSWVVA